MHSPVVLHFYDALGRHTGPIPNPDPASDLELFEEQIPNSYYWQIGEGQYGGADDATTTTIVLQGLDLGAFTIETEELVGDVLATTTRYADIPVTSSTTATIVAGGGVTSTLSMDVDGDGTTDVVLQGGEEGLTTEQLIAILKGIIKTLDMPDKKEAKLMKEIQKLEKELAKEHKSAKVEKRKTKHAFNELIRTINRYEKRKILTHEEAEELLKIIGEIKGSVVE